MAEALLHPKEGSLAPDQLFHPLLRKAFSYEQSRTGPLADKLREPSSLAIVVQTILRTLRGPPSAQRTAALKHLESFHGGLGARFVEAVAEQTSLAELSPLVPSHHVFMGVVSRHRPWLIEALSNTAYQHRLADEALLRQGYPQVFLSACQGASDAKQCLESFLARQSPRVRAAVAARVEWLGLTVQERLRRAPSGDWGTFVWHR